MVLLPYSCEEPLPAGVTNCDVWEYIVVVIWDQGIREEGPIGMVWAGCEDVVAESTSSPIGHPQGIVEEGSEVGETALTVLADVPEIGDCNRDVLCGLRDSYRVRTLSKSRYIPP